MRRRFFFTHFRSHKKRHIWITQLRGSRRWRPPRPSFISPLQTGQMRVKCRQAESRGGAESSERKSRQQDEGSRRSGGWFLGWMTREGLLLPPAHSWSSCGRTSHTNAFIPSLTCGRTFLSSDAVFWAALHLWEFRGSFPPSLWGFLGKWWIKHEGDDWDSH